MTDRDAKHPIDQPLPRDSSGRLILNLKVTLKEDSMTNDPTTDSIESIIRDARRYRRLQILGCAVPDLHVKTAPGSQREILEAVNVSRFGNLDKLIDTDLEIMPSRGEAFPITPGAPLAPMAPMHADVAGTWKQFNRDHLFNHLQTKAKDAPNYYAEQWDALKYWLDSDQSRGRLRAAFELGIKVANEGITGIAQRTDIFNNWCHAFQVPPESSLENKLRRAEERAADLQARLDGVQWQPEIGQALRTARNRAWWVFEQTQAGKPTSSTVQRVEAFERLWSQSAANVLPELVTGSGVFIDVAKLRELSMWTTFKEIKTDNERMLVVALGDALLLAALYRDGKQIDEKMPKEPFKFEGEFGGSSIGAFATGGHIALVDQGKPIPKRNPRLIRPDAKDLEPIDPPESQQAAPWRPAVGDTVKLRGQKHPMTVETTSDKNGAVYECVWFTRDGLLSRNRFKLDTLEPAK